MNNEYHDIKLIDSSEYHKAATTTTTTTESSSSATLLTRIPNQQQQQQPQGEQDHDLDNLDYKQMVLNFVKSKKMIILVIWAIFLKVSSYYKLTITYLCLSGIIMIFLNLGKRQKHEMSAYSVFNKKGEKLLGDTSMGDIDRQFYGNHNPNLYNDGRDNDDDDNNNDPNGTGGFKLQETSINKISKMNNKPCYCGSGKKFKKCCYWRELRAKEEKYKPKQY